MTSSDTFDYNDRYGIKSQRAWVPYAVVLGLLFGTWLMWSALHHARPAISHELIAFDNKNPRNTEIRYTVTRRDSSQSATCVLVARNYDKSIVGQVEDQIPASGESTIMRITHIPSRDDAVNASVISCTLN
jgi:hypothetical protein